MIDILEEIWSTVKRNKLRTALTGFSVAWGIFMIIFLLGAGNGLINAIEQNSNRFLDNSMVIGGGTTSKAYEGYREGRKIELEDKDVKATEDKGGSHIDEMGSELKQDNVTVSLGENYVSGSLTGIYPNYQNINKVEILYGRFINQEDLENTRKTLVISENDAKELLPKTYTTLIGKYVKVGEFAFRIVGISKNDESEMNSEFFTAFTSLRMMYGKGRDAGNIVFSFHGLNTQQENENFEKSLTAKINKNHHAAPDDESSVWVWNRFTQAMQMNTGMSIIHLALWIVGLFTLLSGVVGVSNIMLITVKERTREFGIRKAIGAKPSSILWLIIVESIIITTIFGYVGMIAGIGANQYMDATLGGMNADFGIGQAKMCVNPTVGLEATLVMIIAGTLAGLLPARKAAKIRPIEALRAE